jgi:uncharacterized membrane protein YhhN
MSTQAGRNMVGPIGVYVIALCLMVCSALLCLLRPEWVESAAWAVSVGAILFLVSDSLIAYNTFVAPTPHSDLVTMVTYHLAQFGIILGLILQNAG